MKKLLTILGISIMNVLQAQEPIPLYEVVPNSKPATVEEKAETAADGITRISNVSTPEMFIYKPQQPNGTAVLICPGGGYRILAISHEGHDVAKALNQWGITAFVLKYRLPDSKAMLNKSIAPLQDAERAMQIIRQNAKKWNINPKKIGVMGFSAGGHVAASLSTRYSERLIENPGRVSFRPDFSVLVYPVVSFTDSLTHMGSRDNLIGKNPSEYLVRKYSNEFGVNKKTPPAFLVHAKDDNAVPIGNSLVYYRALQSFKIPSEIRYFEKGGHGFGMHNKKESGDWMEDLLLWLKATRFL